MAFVTTDTFTIASVDFVLQSYSIYSFFQQDHRNQGRYEECIWLFERGVVMLEWAYCYIDAAVRMKSVSRVVLYLISSSNMRVPSSPR
jgi:hypothetical protein